MQITHFNRKSQLVFFTFHFSFKIRKPNKIRKMNNENYKLQITLLN